MEGIRIEFKPLFSLAWPVVLAELGWVSMSLVDTIMVGRLGAEAIGAVSLGGIISITIALFGMGLLLGLDTLVSQNFGAGKIQECHRALIHGVYLSLFLVLPLMSLLWLVSENLHVGGIHPLVAPAAGQYMKAINWGLLPILLYASLRRYLQAMNLVRPVLFALVSANVVNAFGNWILIYGNLGVPPLGVAGAAWATCLARIYMAAVLAGFAFWHDRRHGTGLLETPLHLEFARLERLIRLGFPAALQIVLEVGAFALAGTLAGLLDPPSLAAHQIALNLATFTFMVPLGISVAAAVRVGQAAGRRDSVGMRRSGWTAVLIGELFMSVAALVFILFPSQVIKVFTSEIGVIKTGVSLLLIAALFQLFDGLQVVLTGIMRGAGNTRTPMFCNFVGHWLIGLPIAYVLCFHMGWGVIGLWLGLSTGLIAVASVLILIWIKRPVTY